MAGRIQETWLRPISTRQGISNGRWQYSKDKKKKAIHKTIGAGSSAPGCTEPPLNRGFFPRSRETSKQCSFTFISIVTLLVRSLFQQRGVFWRRLCHYGCIIVFSQSRQRVRSSLNMSGRACAETVWDHITERLLTRCVIGNVRIRRMV